METSLDAYLAALLEEIPSLVKEAEHSEVWGLDLVKGNPEHIKTILTKYLARTSILDYIVVKRARWALSQTLEWRRRITRPKFPHPFSNMPGVADLVYVTRHGSSHVMWIIVDEKVLRRLRIPGTELLAFTQIGRMIDQLMEILVTVLFENFSDDNALRTTFILDCRPFAAEGVKLKENDFRYRLLWALEECIPRYESHFPGLLERLYLINPIQNLLSKLAIPSDMLRKSVVLGQQKDVAIHLGAEVPPGYGGNGVPLAQCDLLSKYKRVENETQAASDPQEIVVESQLATQEPGPADLPGSKSPDEEGKPRLIWSEDIGPPEFVLDPKDLDKMSDLCPGKLGARIVPIDSGWLVKYGQDVRLAEAEALHLVSTTTTIPVPRLIGAYILDDVCYVIMTHEASVPLEYMWDEATEEERDKITSQLWDAVNQLRSIRGTYIGGLHRETCRDPLFDAGWSWRPYTYGPYNSEADLNEGIVQAMEDRFSKRKDGKQHEIGETEYINRQLVRSIKDHEIVFTHGDLRPSNILVKDDRSIVIVDWGMAGFWPEYWEYFRAIVVIPTVKEWGLMVEKYIPPYYVEAHVLEHITSVLWN